MDNANDKQIRLFWRVANARLEDALFLLSMKRHNAAVYLSGYVVECSLKCLLISVTPVLQRGKLVESFRGGWAHDYEVLVSRYYKNGGASFPQNIHRAMSAVSDWTTTMRYDPKMIQPKAARQFIEAVRTIYTFMETRL